MQTRAVSFVPALAESVVDGVHLLHDEDARTRGWLVAFADRRGGVSRPPYDSLNLAARVADEPAHVAENRRRVAAAVGYQPDALALTRQVHGTEVLHVTAGGLRGRADGLRATRPGPVLAILTADCAPVVVANDDSIAVLHAGWRGLAAGIVERGVQEIGGASVAWVGPSIRACCYEVGSEVIDAFEASGLPTTEGRVDTAVTAAAALADAGVTELSVAPQCTSCDPHYFSHRRDGITGRQGAFAALLER